MKRHFDFLFSVAAVAALLCTGLSCKNAKTKKSEGDIPEVTSKAYYPKASGSLRIMSYNVGNFSKYLQLPENVAMVAAMIKEAEADVVALNEIDSLTTRRPVNELALLTEALGGWQWHFGKAMPYQGGSYGEGCVVPADVKVLRKYTVPLPQGDGAEPRAIAVIETDRYVFGASHLDHVSAAARKLQAEAVNAWVKENYDKCDKPVFYCGDMNALPESDVIATLKDSWTMISANEETFSSREPEGCIDYIFHYKKSAPVKSVSCGTMKKFRNGDVLMASDHLPIYVDVEF